MLLIVIVVATLHLLLVGVGAVTPIVNLFYEWIETKDEARYRLGNRLVRLSIVAWIAGGLVGLLLGWLVWSQALSDSLDRLSSKIFFGIIEYFFSLVLMILYLVWRKRVPKPGFMHRSLRCLLPAAAGSNSVYHFPILFSVIGELQRRGISVGEKINGGEFRQTWLLEAAIWARATHVVLAGVAFVGVAALMIAAKAKRDEDEPLYRTSALAGARLAMAAVIGQILTGFWLVTTLSPSEQTRLMGGDTIATLAFAAGALLAFYWLNLLGQGIVVPFESGAIRRIAGVGLLTMVCMVTATQRCRSLDRLLDRLSDRAESSQSNSENSTTFRIPPLSFPAMPLGDPLLARLENLRDLKIYET